jgi:HD-GYP domain-containing protein (c-di-GMP phosphodiesterase class II)
MDSSVSSRATQEAVEALMHRLAELNQIGVSLSQEKDIDHLLERILLAAKKITNADGGTLYRCHAATRDRLTFEIIRTDSLGIAMGGTSGTEIALDPIYLRDAEGRENTSTVAAFAALRNRTVAIADVDRAEGFDFSGTKAFDQKTGYRSKSFLAVPLQDHAGENIGVLQLINAKDRETREVVAFSETDVRFAESLASQASVVLTNRSLVLQLEELFESFVTLLNKAIDEKSPYTGGHCARVPVLTMMLAEAAHATQAGPLAAWRMSDQDRYELKIAGMLHDCGKVTTPVHIVDKATKLQTIYDRIDLIDTRFEVIKRDAELAAWRAKATASDTEAVEQIELEFRRRIAEMDADREFLRDCNIGSERMSPADRDRILAIATKYRWRNPAGVEVDFLSADEIENLTIVAGTLTAEERRIINHHITVTIRMLEALPWPRHLQNVPEYAGGHHERMDGRGYPRGLTREQMSVQARIMGIADIFEALTARDRPYKPGKSLAESLQILGQMSLEGHIDPDLFQIFVRERVFLTYANQFLDHRQRDEVEVNKIPGYFGD